MTYRTLVTAQKLQQSPLDSLFRLRHTLSASHRPCTVLSRLYHGKFIRSAHNFPPLSLKYKIYSRDIRCKHTINARCHQNRCFSAALACRDADKDQQEKPYVHTQPFPPYSIFSYAPSRNHNPICTKSSPTSTTTTITTYLPYLVLPNVAKHSHSRLADRLRNSLPPALHENAYTLPNILTFSRLLSAPLIGYLLVTDLHIPALSLFIYAGFTDLIDGWLARRYKQQTVVGTVIDPMADKTLMTVVTVALAWKGAMPLTLAGLILGRDALLGVAAIYYRYISLPPPKTLARFWDFSLPSAEVHPTGISKVNTALQLGLIGWTMGAIAVGGDLGVWGPEGALGAMWWVVGATTVWSGASYIYTKDAVKILGAAGKTKSGR